MSQKLLILDVDGTLVYSSEKKLNREPDFLCFPYFVYKRPGLNAFLLECARHFDLAVWSAGTQDYVDSIAVQIDPPTEFRFVWSRERCTQQRNELEIWFIKDLKKIKRKGYSLQKTLIVEDSPKAVERNYGNAIYVRTFEGDDSDRELGPLCEYLKTLVSVEDVRKIEKRDWRSM